MKKLLLTASALLAFTYGAFAQSFNVASGTADTMYMVYTGSSDLWIHNNIYSTSATPVTIKWRVTDYSIASGWNFDGFCDNVLCYVGDGLLSGAIKTSSPYDNTEAGNTFEARFDGTSADVNSSAFVTVNARDAATGNERNLTFIAQKFPTGLTQVTTSEDNISIYPNPALTNVNVIFSSSLQVKNVAIYNMIGKVVKAYKVSGNSANLGLDGLPAGVYIMRLMDGNNKVVGTRRFNHQ